MADFPNSFEDLIKSDPPDMDERFPFARYVPQDRAENLEFREWLHDRGFVSGRERSLITQACARDMLFFISAFLRIKQESPLPADLPFIPWDTQRDYLELLYDTRKAVMDDPEGLTRGDVGTDKPRWHGWSWLNLAEGLHVAMFTPGSTGLIGSREENDVDKTGSSKSLFWKLDYFIEHLPRWMVPDCYWSRTRGYPTPSKAYRSKLKFHFPDKGTMLGGATHENFGRSGRYAWMMLDEFSHVDRGQLGMGDKIWTSTTSTCLLRRVLSTPFGKSNKFAKLRFSGDIQWFTTFWFDDPVKRNKGYKLTYDMDVGPVRLHRGDLWSPWCESARKAMNDDRLFAQEILLSYEGTESLYFEASLTIIKSKQVAKPVWIGNVKIGDNARIASLEGDESGFLKLWEPFGDGHTWKRGVYVSGVDVASGSRDKEGRGASNSVSAIGRLEGEKLVKIAEYATHGLMPWIFARIVHALGWCFLTERGLPAYQVVESNGPGDYVISELLYKYGYPNYYLDPNSRGEKAGFHMQIVRGKNSAGDLSGSKIDSFEEHRRWLAEGLYEEPSFDTYREMEQYQYSPDAGPYHVQEKNTLDTGQARSNHGDFVVATTMMIWGARTLLKDMRKGIKDAPPPPGTLAWHIRDRKRNAAGAWR